MELTQIIKIVTVIVTWILGVISKKSKFIKNNLIPVQNILIGLVVAIVELIITKDFDASIIFSGLFAGGCYDLFKNLLEIVKNYQKKEGI